MAQALSQTWLTFEEYLAYDDGTDNRYELEAGVLTLMPPESPRNSRIALWLLLSIGLLILVAVVLWF
jgi:Uma2 family endonuclease